MAVQFEQPIAYSCCSSVLCF